MTSFHMLAPAASKPSVSKPPLFTPFLTRIRGRRGVAASRASAHIKYCWSWELVGDFVVMLCSWHNYIVKYRCTSHISQRANMPPEPPFFATPGNIRCAGECVRVCMKWSLLFSPRLQDSFSSLELSIFNTEIYEAQRVFEPESTLHPLNLF